MRYESKLRIYLALLAAAVTAAIILMPPPASSHLPELSRFGNNLASNHWNSNTCGKAAAAAWNVLPDATLDVICDMA